MPFDQVGYQPETVVQDEVLRCLIEARKLIEKPENWCKGEYARAADGEVAIGKPAVSWCSWGAIRAAGMDPNDISYLLNAMLPEGATGYMGFNDDPTTTHADVLNLFDRAIAARRAQVQP